MGDIFRPRECLNGANIRRFPESCKKSPKILREFKKLSVTYVEPDSARHTESVAFVCPRLSSAFQYGLGVATIVATALLGVVVLVGVVASLFVHVGTLHDALALD